jgi:hypothetical protein
MFIYIHIGNLFTTSIRQQCRESTLSSSRIRRRWYTWIRDGGNRIRITFVESSPSSESFCRPCDWRSLWAHSLYSGAMRTFHGRWFLLNCLSPCDNFHQSVASKENYWNEVIQRYRQIWKCNDWPSPPRMWQIACIGWKWHTRVHLFLRIHQKKRNHGIYAMVGQKKTPYTHVGEGSLKTVMDSWPNAWREGRVWSWSIHIVK